MTRVKLSRKVDNHLTISPPILIQPMRGPVAVALLAIGWLAAPALAQQASVDQSLFSYSPESRSLDHALQLAEFEDYREPAGHLEDGALQIALETQVVGWRPWGDDGPVLQAHTFAEAGVAAKVSAPLIRVSAGTPVHVRLHNTLSDTLFVRGLRNRGQLPPPGMPAFPAAIRLAFVGDSVVVAPGTTGEVRFTPTVPGTYYYYGRTSSSGRPVTADPPFDGQGPDTPMVGVLIVDPPGETPDEEERIFVISQWADHDIPESWQPSVRFLINGRSWPNTERLVYAQGDTVRWRVINQSGAFHPMHLHGFYFNVDEWTFQTGAPFVAQGNMPMAVTWPMPATSSMRISWVAEAAGNWLFHCHLMRHMSQAQSAPRPADHLPAPADRAPHLADHAPQQAGHAHRAGDHSDRSLEEGGLNAMAGLVMGITILPDEAHARPPEVVRRRLTLHITRRPQVFGAEAAYAFVLQDGAEPPAADSIQFPGSPIVLTRGEPTEIVVRNRADVPLGVHWHGLELESWADGVPDWSGTPESPVPATAPGDSLVVRITPRRSGTFMYHVHSEPGHQLAQGLYGAFLVLEPGRTWDREQDRIFVLGSLGAGEDPPPAFNGRTEPDTLEFLAGVTYRLRFMHISPDDDKSIRLLSGDEPVLWQPIALDGADFPSSEPATKAADVRFFDVGSTRDFLWAPRQPGDLTLRVVTRFDPGASGFRRNAPPPHTMNIPVRVR